MKTTIDALVEAPELALSSHNVHLTTYPPQDAWLARGVEAKARYLRVGRMGADAAALEHLPRALDMYDQLLSLSTPLQMTHALRETLTRMQRGEVLGAAGGGGA